MDDPSASAACQGCGATVEGKDAAPFNLLFETNVGANDRAWLRPETAQGIFVSALRGGAVPLTTPLPFGVAQQGKAFRNEIAPGHFLFRSREFEQAELEWLCAEEDVPRWFEHWRGESERFIVEDCGLAPERVRVRDHARDELAHYASGAADVEYAYPHGWGELLGVACRGDHDLRAHLDASGEKWPGGAPVPHVVEPSLGVDRLVMAVLLEAMQPSAALAEREWDVLNFVPDLAPYRVSVLPVVGAEGSGLPARARALYARLGAAGVSVSYDRGGSVGRRFKRQDGLGTPVCVTVDSDEGVTVRDRNTMEQRRMSERELFEMLLMDPFVES